MDIMNPMPERNPEQEARDFILRARQALWRAAKSIMEVSPEADLLQIFPSPTERRESDEGLTLTPGQEASLRKSASELGFDREIDRTASSVGLEPGYTAFIESGQVHKVLAEIGNCLEDGSAKPASIIVGGGLRKVDSLDERSIAARLLKLEESEVGATEYDVVRQAISSVEGSVPLEQPQVLPYSYDIQNGNEVKEAENGQFLVVGHVQGIPVTLMRIDREDYEEEGKPKFRKQPDSAGVMKIIDGVLRLSKVESSIGFHTSATYQTSREVDAKRAAIQTGRFCAVPSYGTARLARVKGEPAPSLVAINQIPGELHRIENQLRKLEEVLPDDFATQELVHEEIAKDSPVALETVVPEDPTPPSL